MKGGIASRLAIIFSLLVLVATATVGFLVFWEARETLITTSADRLVHTAETVEVRFNASLEAISKDVLFLAETPPVQGIVRARSDWQRIDTETYISDTEWRGQLADIFDVFLQNRPSYLQIRYIGLADSARELVRVERRAGETARVVGRDLRARADQMYVRETVELADGQVYLSDIEHTLEVSGEGPLGIPMLRAATPVYDAAGAPFGLLIIDVDFRFVLRTLDALTDSDLSLYLANNRGELLLHPDSTREAASRRLLQEDFPDVAAWFGESGRHGPAERSLLETGAPVLAYFERVPFYRAETPKFLALGVTAPRDHILGGVTRVRTRSAFITVLFALAGIVLALVFSQYLTRPLRMVTRAISSFGRDDERHLDLPIRRQDEIGVLARTFDTMARQIQDQIRELEDRAHRQRIILETSAEGIIVTDAQGTIETFNRSAERMFGYHAEDVLGTNIEMLLLSPDSEPSTNGQASRDEGRPWHYGQGQEGTGRRKDGSTFPLSLALSSFDLAGEKKYAGFLQDITKRKEYEQTLRRAKLSAEAANRAKSAFLANMSHEIRTPLTGIIGFASLLARQATGNHRKFARLIESSGERLKETLNTVLDLAKLEANRVEIELDVLQVSNEVQSAVQIFQAHADERGLDLRFEATPAGEIAAARLDRGAFGSILHNLIGNAVKFTQHGGVTVRVDADDDRVYVHVEDTGVGIDEKFIPHLFDVFRQESTGLSRTHEGSGLGLSITQRLVSLLDGEIDVESEKGKGSTFTVSFARVEHEQDEGVGMGELRLDVNQEPGGERGRVLLVEDNEHTQFLIQSLLEEAFEVIVVSNAEEALLEAFSTEYDMVLLDINLGEGPNGADVLRELRAMPAYQDVPIAAITAYALPGDRERFLDMGFSAYLSKPFNADELLSLTAEL